MSWSRCRVGDIDWRRGELLVRSKGGWQYPLPLPVDVGNTLAGHLRVRGRDDSWRQVFLRVRPPWGPLTPTAVRGAIRQDAPASGVVTADAIARTDLELVALPDDLRLPDLCTHRLRHAVAGGLLREGAALHEIGQVLRHHGLATTAVYAKVGHLRWRPSPSPGPGASHDRPRIGSGRLPRGSSRRRLPPR